MRLGLGVWIVDDRETGHQTYELMPAFARFGLHLIFVNLNVSLHETEVLICTWFTSPETERGSLGLGIRSESVTGHHASP